MSPEKTKIHNSKISEIIAIINGANRVGLITHKNSDGDAFGSMLGMQRLLEEAGKKTVIFSNEELIQSFCFLKEKVNYHPVEKYEKVDLLIAFDGNFVDRFTIPEIFTKAKEDGAKIIVIDHHLEGGIGDISDVYWYDEKSSSTAEMVLKVAKKMPLKIDKITATLLLLGVELDTNSLQFSNAGPDSFEAVSELLKLGARMKLVVENAFGGKSLASLKLLGRVVDRLKLDPKTGWAISFITSADNKELGLVPGSASGVVNFMEQAEGIKLVAVFEDKGDGTIKASVRSNNAVGVDAVTIANFFGGGGHVKAAGYEFKGTLQEAMQALEDYKQSKVIDSKR
jgi:phosphoesterase RecJ-like protein